MTLIGPHRNKLGERAVRRRGGAGAAQHDGLAAQIAAARLAVFTKTTSPGRVDRHPGADSRRFHIGRGGSDVRGKFVTEDEWPGRNKRGAISVFEIVHVRSADPRLPDPQEDHPWPELGQCHFVQANVFGAVEDTCQHGFVHGFLVVWLMP